MEEVTLAISGMRCGGCGTNVRNALSAVPGTRVDAVTVGSATVTYDESQTTTAAIAQAVVDAGYEPIQSPTLAGAAGISGGVEGTGSTARFAAPSALATDRRGNVLGLDGYGRLRQVASDRRARRLARSAAREVRGLRAPGHGGGRGG